MGWRESGAFVLLSALWGASFLFIRKAAPVLGAVVVADSRVLLASLALLLYAALIRFKPDLRSRWRQFLILGALNSAIPFSLIALAELTLPASFAAILNATTPLFTAVVAVLWGKERMTGKKGLGLGLGLVGVAVVVGWNEFSLTPALLLAVGASLLASLSYGVAGVYSKTTFKGVPTLTLAVGQLLGAGLLLLPLAVPTLPDSWPSGEVIGAMVALALLCTGLAYLLFFYLMARTSSTVTLSVTFLVPFFGILWGALFLSEQIGLGSLLGLGLILASLVLITGLRLPLKLKGKQPISTP